MAVNNQESDFFDKQFGKSLKSLNSSSELLLAYDGVLNNETLSKLELEVESKILKQNFSKQVVKKIFFISVEALQNQYIHGYKDDNGSQHNFFLLAHTNNSVNIFAANLISTNSIKSVEEQIEKINSFSTPTDLKAYYLEHLENNELTEKGGAGLGFITIAMKSGNKIKPFFEPINEKHTFFLLEVKISLD